MSGTRLRIQHRTSYEYERPVRNSKNEARMTPAPTAWQQISHTRLRINPEPTHRVAYRDYFGTAVEFFEVTPEHDRLEAVATSDVLMSILPSLDFPATDEKRAVEYLPASPMIQWGSDVTELAAALRRETASDTVWSVIDWMRAEMTYQPGTTEVGTSVHEVLEARRGVCQDYVHLCCALLRASEIPARYVSGYFSPKPLEPGESVDAQSHAWVEALIPGLSLLPVDPTNDVAPGPHHVKVGHGRDYTDVLPFLGVHSVAAEQTLEVAVTITRLS